MRVNLLHMRAQTSQPVHEILATRRSPRSLNESSKIAPADLLAILEAARWAPSAMNGQPWRFIVGVRGDATFNKILEALAPTNALWAKNASALVLTLGESTKADGQINPDYKYDCGLAVAQMVFETHHRGFIAHQMSGFNKESATKLFEIPANLTPVVVVAIGKQDVPEKLEGQLYDREIAERVRKPLSEIVIEGLPS